jgi:hypothetical protein
MKTVAAALIVAMAAFILVGCSALQASPVPQSNTIPSPSPSQAIATASPTPPASLGPEPTATPTAVPTDCPVEAETGRLPSDRMVDATVTSTDDADIVTFVLGDPSSPSPPQGPSEGSIAIAEPPFVEGASGLPVEVDGRRVLELRFTGMTLGDEDLTPTYDGPFEFHPDLPALRSVIQREQFEGVISWYVGYDGPGCVTLASDQRSVTVVIAHGPG